MSEAEKSQMFENLMIYINDLLSEKLLFEGLDMGVLASSAGTCDMT